MSDCHCHLTNWYLLVKFFILHQIQQNIEININYSHQFSTVYLFGIVSPILTWERVDKLFFLLSWDVPKLLKFFYLECALLDFLPCLLLNSLLVMAISKGFFQGLEEQSSCCKALRPRWQPSKICFMVILYIISM